MNVEGAGLWLQAAAAVGAAAGARRRVGSRLLVASALIGSGLLARLAAAFAGQDWTWVTVVDNTRSGVGPWLRVAGLWAGPEGSLLLWTVLLAWAAVVAVALAGEEARPATIRLGAGLLAGYSLVLAATASPFARLAAPAVDGLGLQPVLEHPAMVWHPPLLYVGLIGLLVPTLVAAGRLLPPAPSRPAVAPAGSGAPPGPVVATRAGVDADSPPAPPGLGLALAVLAAGLLTGARWADVELGWGGWWAWDPIESAGLVAWCCGAAALHAHDARASGPGRASVVGPPRAAAALAVAPGLAALWATTLTRIGVVSSVHAFADRPHLRVGLVAVAGMASAAAALVVARADRPGSAEGFPPAAPGQEAHAAAVASERARTRRWAVGVLATAALLVAVGAYEPLVEAATTGDRVAVAGPYYSRLLWPVAVAGTALMVRADRRWWPALAGAAAGGATVPSGATASTVVLSAAAGALLASSVAGLVAGGARRRGVVAHAGVGLFLLGVAGTTAGRVEAVWAPTGIAVEAAGLPLRHQSISLVDDGAVARAVGSVDVGGTELHPSLAAYRLRGVSTAEQAHHRRGLDELQVTLLDGTATGARYRVAWLPRLLLVWLGGAVTAIGLLAPRTRPGAGVQGLRRRLRASSSATVPPPSLPPSPSAFPPSAD